MKKGIKLVVVNGKGGASKSTTSLQVASVNEIEERLKKTNMFVSLSTKK